LSIILNNLKDAPKARNKDHVLVTAKNAANAAKKALPLAPLKALKMPKANAAKTAKNNSFCSHLHLS
jgi:hypothetical protein